MRLCTRVHYTRHYTRADVVGLRSLKRSGLRGGRVVVRHEVLKLLRGPGQVVQTAVGVPDRLR